ncbi:DUF983 domain-containing protein [Amycolatopsis antarctica]|uniref:DUF983 domain-containing protein n=1 Tax=Amycolatopsis antarctica TaxID=1854586 RepID=A0A263CY80_9PSEU|nr:DUF983 domain-containing protein [Amycolatopsis antarctica]OZM70055.1 DUF983 domain-containing protein [Amycolatopsis antarctica]
MTRVVQGSDGRDWVVRGQMEWRRPAIGDDFDHDVAGSYTPGIVMMGVCILLGIVLVIWRPADVVVPTWIPLALLLLALFFPLRWILRRPWTVVAETDGDQNGEKPSERWVGTIRGFFTVRGEMAKVAKSIKKYALPDFDGPLRPVE